MQQADQGEQTAAITDLSDWAGVIDQLVKDRLCNFADGRVGFQHDLFADWARQRVILGKGNETREFLEPRITKPHWHRAIRLYGLHLLEQHAGLERWRTAFQELPFAQDLLLEAAVYASNPFGVLERLRGELMANGGGLLRRPVCPSVGVADSDCFGPAAGRLSAPTIGEHRESPFSR